MSVQAPSLPQRFEELRTLGSGGAGAVYLVRDRETGEQLALKRLLRADTQSVLRLKREFRSLSDIHHPNLVKLYELGHDRTSAFFTMEYLQGEELKDYLQRCELAAVVNDNRGHDAAWIARVLDAFQQLASAVCALHRAGVLHRDLKPSNVMVSDGRVVVLDFGIALEVGESAATITEDKLGAGTPAYMAPEQIEGKHLGEPNDWYAFGAMLYEALSGKLPIQGTLLELLERKVAQDPAPIAAVVPGLPPAISELCMALLHRAPEQRPSGEQVMSVLRAQSIRADAPGQLTETLVSRTDDEQEISLYGRDAELATLWGVFRKVQAGAFAVVHVSGESGSGKSLLVQHFTDDVERHGFLSGDAQPLVLRSRCHERETLPFKALDGAMDALVNHLLREADIVVSHALPRELHALTQLFPALHRLPAAQRLLEGSKPLAGMSQARAQAESGLRELLRRLSAQRPIVLWIDDLQWGDLDSIAIVTSWLTATLLPHVMLVLSYRSEEIATSPCLTLLRQRSADDPSIETFIQSRALSDSHIGELCHRRFASTRVPLPAQSRMVARIVREAQGSPFLASQLASLAVAQPSRGEDQLASLTLEQLVRNRSRTLSNGARQLLNALSAAGRPLSLTIALQAAGIKTGARAIIHELRGLHLIRTRDSANERLLEVYHDRLREVVYGMMTPDEQRQLDQQLLAALRASGNSDNDWLHTLALAVGEREAAFRYGLAAAERASATLAFERAAELYERCVALSDNPAANGGALLEKLALTFARAGHGTKAATTYLTAAQGVDAEQAYRFERAAASHLLCSGHFDEGEALLQKVLARLRLSAPTSEAGLYAAVAWEHTRIAIRGLEYTPRPRSEISFKEYYAAELCGMLSIETAAYDPLRAAYYQARCLRVALAAGEPEGIARALCAAATMVSVSGSEQAKRRADELLARAEAISATMDSALLRTNIVSARAICAFLTGRIAESLDLCYQADHLHRTSTVESEYHHRFTIAAARIGVLLQLGEYLSAESELQVYLKEAASTENINAELHITMAQAWADVNAARAEQAVARLDRQREQLPRQGFGLLHVLHMISVLRVGCATGEYDWALDTTHEHWQTFQRSVVRRSDSFSMFSYEVHARLLLCRYARDGRAEQAERSVSVHLKSLAKSQRADAHAEVSRIKARLAFMRHDKAAAQRHLEASLAGFEKWGARDQIARDSYALGLLVGGERGQALMQEGLARLRALGVVDPLRDLKGYFPEMLKA